MAIESFAPLFILMAPVLIVAMALRFKRKQTEARYRTLLQLADKGVDLPWAMLSEQQTPVMDRRRAVVLICGGLGLMLCLWALPVDDGEGRRIGELWGLGVLPVMLGLGYLLNWWLATRVDPANGS
jgi:hypothetical protein